jgi:hypothetical protein
LSLFFLEVSYLRCSCRELWCHTCHQVYAYSSQSLCCWRAYEEENLKIQILPLFHWPKWMNWTNI